MYNVDHSYLFHIVYCDAATEKNAFYFDRISTHLRPVWESVCK